MASPDQTWNAAAICQALGCPGCFDCREDDSDTTWDGKDDGPEQETPHGCDWACTNPFCANDTPHAHPGDCPDCDEALVLLDANGHEVTT